MTTEEFDLKKFITDDGLIEHLRKAGSIWFRNDDLLMLEELIRRYKQKSWRKESVDGQRT